MCGEKGKKGGDKVWKEEGRGIIRERGVSTR